MHDQPRIWFVTGAAHGLGRVLARAALMRGDIVVGTSADGELASDAGFRSARLAGDFHPVDMTPTAAGSVRGALAQALALHGRIDVIVIHSEDPPPGSTEAAHWFDLHFLGPLRVMQAALPILRAQGHGRIVDVSSRTLAPRAGWDVYAVAANALQHSSQSLTDELRQLGIEVLRVDPDAVDADAVDCIGEPALPLDCAPRPELASGRV